MKILAFDIDGTICTTDCPYDEAKPYKQVIDKINSLYDKGNWILIFTARGSGSGIDYYEFTKEQLESWRLKYHELKMGKPLFDVLIDDRVKSNLDWYKENGLEIYEK